jgi:hypothetical protein
MQNLAKEIREMKEEERVVKERLAKDLQDLGIEVPVTAPFGPISDLYISEDLEVYYKSKKTGALEPCDPAIADSALRDVLLERRKELREHIDSLIELCKRVEGKLP